MAQPDMLGVDIGGVLIDKVNDGTDTSFFSNNFLNTTAVAGAFEALRRLCDARFGARIVIVSKCGPSVQRKSLLWLEHHDFYRRTGVAAANVHFCRERKDKAPICARLGVSHFVDDRLDVLGHLATVRARYLFAPSADDAARAARAGMRVVQSWPDLVAELV